MAVRFSDIPATSMAARTFYRALYRNNKITGFRNFDLFNFDSGYI